MSSTPTMPAGDNLPTKRLALGGKSPLVRAGATIGTLSRSQRRVPTPVHGPISNSFITSNPTFCEYFEWSTS